MLDSLSEHFGRLGSWIELNPYLTVFITVFLTLCFLPGLILVKTQNDGLYLWIPKNTDLWENFR